MADERELKIVISAQDNASATLKQVAGQAKSTADSIGNSLRGSVVQLGAAFAVTTGVVLTSIKAYAESETVAIALDQALKNVGDTQGITADSVNRLSTALQQQSRFSDEAITTSQTMLISFGNFSSKTLPQAEQAIIDVATAMKMDLTAATKTVGLALSEPADAMNKLRRAGIFLSDDQSDLIKKLVETGESAKAQEILIKELSKTYGGRASADAKSLSAQMEILKNNIDDTQEILGKGLVDALTEAAGGMDNLNSKILEVNQFLIAHKDIVAAVSVALLVVVAVLGVLFVAALVVVAGTVGLVVIAIGAVVAAIAFLATMIAFHWQEIVKWTQNLWTNIQTSFNNIVTTIRTFLTSIPTEIMNFLVAIAQMWTDFWLVQVPYAIGFAVGYVVATIQQFVMDIINFILNLDTTLSALWLRIQQMVITIWTNIALWLRTEVSQWPTRIQSWLATIPTIVSNIFENMKQFLIAKLNEAWQAVTGWADKIMGILNGIKSAAEAAINAVSKGLNAGGKVGSKQFGGYVPTTGLTLLHAGEYVLSKDMQRGRGPVSSSITNNNNNQPITVNANVQSDGDWDAMGYKLAWILRNS